MSGRIPQRTIDEVLSRVPLSDVIGEYVKLQRRGNRLVGLCPFHREKTPSFGVNDERGVYHCFGCKASGNAVRFLMEHDGLSFPDAVQRLAERAGVTIEREESGDPNAQARRSERDRYFEITGRARDYYIQCLQSGVWEAPHTYLESRGVDDDTARAFGLGFAPPDWTGLVDTLGRAGFPMEEVEHAGLAIPRNGGGGHYDRFRNRLMFPVVNLSRQVLAFSGRTLDPAEKAKYVNSPETAWYTKGRELFGLQAAQRAIRDSGTAILVEGNFDVVSLHARGFANVVAPLGTALTPEQALLLRRFAERVVLAFDGDRAGRTATERALEILLAAEFPRIDVCPIPDGSDPDDLVRNGGAETFDALLQRARSAVDARIDALVAPALGAADPATKRQAAIAVGDLLARISDPLVRQRYLGVTAQRLEVDEPVLLRYVRRRDASPAQERVNPAPSEERTPLAPLHPHEALLVALLADRPQLLESMLRLRTFDVIEHEPLARFLEAAADAWARGTLPHLRGAIEHAEPEALRPLLYDALAQDRTWREDAVERAFDDTIRQLTLRWLHATRRRAELELRQLEADRQHDLVLAALGRIQRLDRMRLDILNHASGAAAHARPL